ncbi:MAG TPA: hypothetical protein DDW95_14885, partial [Alphaproteobacteria bacterium]|nr:hypothetical protein [Alphaproteobacteria bacterium]
MPYDQADIPCYQISAIATKQKPALSGKRAGCKRGMKILFITSNRIGDAILSSGLLAQLADQYRTARFTVAAGPAAAPLFQDMPRLERIIVLEKRPLAGHWRKLWLNCLLHRWDIIVDLRGSAIAWLLWCRRRLVHRSQQ